MEPEGYTVSSTIPKLNIKGKIIRLIKITSLIVKLISIRLRKKIKGFYFSLLRKFRNPSGFEQAQETARPRLKRFRFPKIKFGKYLVIVVLLVAAYFVGRVIFSTAPSSTDKISIKGATNTQELNKEFRFPLRDEDGEEISELKYVLEKAELRDEIVVKGQRATAIAGRTFLIVNLKISNDFGQPIEIDTRDYIRLVVNDNEAELLAPDIHNDPVEVQAISTKYTRVGFPINTTDRNLKLRVGELQGEKEDVVLNL